MLAHRLNPVQTQGVQHGTCTFHDTQHHDCACEPEVEDGHHDDGALDAGEGECVLHGHVPEDDGETLMGEGEGPETEVGRSVGDAVEAEFCRIVSRDLHRDDMCELTDGVNDLVDHDFAELKLLVVLAMAEILSNHGNAVVIISEAFASAVHGTTILVIIVKRTDTLALADTTVSESASLVVLVPKVERLEEEEDWHAYERREEKDNLKCGLAGIQRCCSWLERTRLQEHENQHVQQTGRALTTGRPVDAPLVHNRESKVTKDGLEEDHTRDEVAPDIDLGLEVASVDECPHEREGHVAPTEQNTELHLVAVGEEQVVLRVVPAVIQTEWVGVALNASRGRASTIVVPDPHGLEPGKSERESIAVEETGVDGEDTHHEHDVTTVEHHGKQLVQLATFQALLIVNHGRGCEQQNGTVTSITEHDSEHEREGDNGRQSRVDFAVLDRSVRVDDGLEAYSEPVRLEVSRGCLGGLDLVDDCGNRETSPFVDIRKCGLDQSKTVGGCPRFSNERLPLVVVRELVQRLVGGLLFLNDNHPCSQVATNSSKFGVQSRLGVLQDTGQVAQAGVDLADLVAAELAVLIYAVQVGTERLGDLANLGDDLLSVRKDDEDVLAGLLVVLWVDDGLGDLRLVHVQVATKRTPQNPLESSHTLAGDDTSDEANVHDGEGTLGAIVLAVLLYIL
jgi:hypothetical protein